MSMITDSLAVDEWTRSMVEVDAAAARAALADRLQLADVDLEHPAAVAVLAAVVAAGWRPPAPGTPVGQNIFSTVEPDPPSEPLFGDSAGIGGGHAARPCDSDDHGGRGPTSPAGHGWRSRRTWHRHGRCR